MQSIIAAVDFSDVTETQVDQAARVARAFSAQLYLLHVLPPEPAFIGYAPGPGSVQETVEEAREANRRKVQQYEEKLRSEGVQIEGITRQGPTVDTVMDEATRVQADLLIVGSHGHGALFDLLLGSVSSGVLQHASCPVLVIPSNP